MILYDDGFWVEWEDSRIVTVTGRLGAGKTLLGMTLAERFLKRGYRLLTNVRCVWADGEFPEGEDGARRAVVLLDEGGLYIRDMAAVAALAAFSRKLDVYVIICGRREPHAELCELVIRPLFDFRRNFMVPLWLWRWENRSAVKPYGGFLIEVGRSGYYGTFDTVDPAAAASSILAFTRGWAARLLERYGHEVAVSGVAGGGGQYDSVPAVDEFATAAERLRQALAVPAAAGRRRR